MFRLSPLLALLVGCGGGEAVEHNVVVIVVDDLGYGDLGCYGGGDVPTPAIDRLAAGGVRFTQAYATSSLCSPSRAALLTGRYQQRFGHENNTGDVVRQRELGIGLPLTERTLADHLAQAGYVTGAIGKWHLGVEPRFHPLRRGFASFFGHLGGGHPYTRWDDAETGPILRGEEPQSGDTYLTEAFTDEAVAFVRAHRDEPFFLYLAYNAPHAPLEAPAEAIARVAPQDSEERRTYLAMVDVLDSGIGRVMEALEECGVEDETLVVFLNDNGAPRQYPGDNGLLRGHKQSHYEGGVRVPMIVRWPQRAPSGRVEHALVSTLDVVPTALAAASVDVSVELDGIDLASVWTDDTPPGRDLFWRRGERSAVRRGDWKIVCTRRRVELFDLATDPGETTDVADEHPARVEELSAAFEAWQAPLVAPLWEWVERE